MLINPRKKVHRNLKPALAPLLTSAIRRKMFTAQLFTHLVETGTTSLTESLPREFDFGR